MRNFDSETSILPRRAQNSLRSKSKRDGPALNPQRSDWILLLTNDRAAPALDTESKQMFSSGNVPNDCLPSDHRYSERVISVAIFTLAWQFLTDNSSPDLFVDMVPQLLPQPKTTPCEGAWQHASACVRN